MDSESPDTPQTQQDFLDTSTELTHSLASDSPLSDKNSHVIVSEAVEVSDKICFFDFMVSWHSHEHGHQADLYVDVLGVSFIIGNFPLL